MAAKRSITDFKIFFQGKYEANPNTSNHSGFINKGNLKVYKPDAQGQLTSHFSDEEFQKWQENSETRGWNLYGNHSFEILETKVTSVELDYGESKDEELVGKSVSLHGHELEHHRTSPKIVDLGIHITTQLFADKLVIGDHDNNITLSNFSVGCMRAFNPKQILNISSEFPDEAASGRFYFLCDPKDVTIQGSSPALAALKESMQNKPQIVIWLTLLNTVHGPKSAYRNFATPAYGTLQGYITTLDDLFKLEDRCLIPQEATSGTVSLCINPTKKVISLDMMTAVPFAGRNEEHLKVKKEEMLAENKTHGTSRIDATHVPVLLERAPMDLQLAFQTDEGNLTMLGSIQIGPHGCANLRYTVDSDWSKGIFVITDSVGNVMFTERETNCYVEHPCVYLEHSELVTEPCRTKIHVFHRGRPAANHPIYLQPFTEMNNIEKATWNGATPKMVQFDSEEYKTDDKGTATVAMKGIASGTAVIIIRDKKYAKEKKQLDLTDHIAENWFAVRILPCDTKLLKTPKEERLSWDFIYSNILRYYHLVYPNTPDKNFVDLSSEASVKEKAALLLKVTSKEGVYKTWYLPVSRDLSDAKRTILHEYLSSFKNIPADT